MSPDTTRLTYWSAGGDIVTTGGRFLDHDEARQLRLFYLAAATRGDDAARAHCTRCASEIFDAMAGAQRWRRAA